MPNRILREEILNSDRINALSPGAELFYRRLMSVVDDYGRIENRAAILWVKCYPLQLDRIGVLEVCGWLAECARQNGLVTEYEIGGKNYLQINNFGQRKRHEKCPGPPTADISPPEDGDKTADGERAAARATTSHSHSTSTSQKVLEQKKDVAEIWAAAGFEDGEEFETWFRDLYAKHPTRGEPQIAQDSIRNAIVAGELTRAQFESSYAAYRACRAWSRDGGRYIPKLSTFCVARDWQFPPTDVVPPRAKPRPPTPEEMAAHEAWMAEQERLNSESEANRKRGNL